MCYENSSQENKKAMLEQAVLTRTPEELSAILRQLAPIEHTARALGLACRFRGLESVRVLVEGGADFVNRDFTVTYYWLMVLEMNSALRRAYYIDRTDGCFTNTVTVKDRQFNVLPMEQRAAIVGYLYENREKVCLDAGELLYYAMMSGSKRIVRLLKEAGVKFTQQRIAELTENGRSYEWQEFCRMAGGLGDEAYLEALGSIVAELGGSRLHYTESVYWENCNRYREQFWLYNPDIFRFILAHFNQKKMNKARLMKGAIDRGSVACLEICEENGWLSAPRKRDEMIQYASQSGAVECNAWLMEFKNRTADFAAEREKAEKKMMRELNASPDSVTELKKIWGYEKREDDTIAITRYKGVQTEVTVPQKIGNCVVTEIGDRAFSAAAPRLKKEQVLLRRSITRITLPETICAIAEGAFYDCRSLEQINIPAGVTAISARTFWNCKCLRAIELPEGITSIGECAFACCSSLSTLRLPGDITVIESEAFYSCQSLTSVTIPAKAAVIGRCAFYGCSALETAVIQEGVTEIRQLAFAECSSLRSVVLPGSIQRIKNNTRKGHTPETVFERDVNVTVTAVPDSYAEKYCKRNNIPVINGCAV